MNYEEFKTEFMQRLVKKAAESGNTWNYKLFEDGSVSEEPLDHEFIRDTNRKYNQTESDTLRGDFLRIMQENGGEENVARFEMKYLHDSFLEDGWEFVWKIIDSNLDYAKNISAQEITSVIDRYDKIKDRLILRPLNYTDNKYQLKNCVYRQVGDMALVLYLFISDTSEYGLLTTKVPKEVSEKWGKSTEEVLETALVNSNIRAVPRMYNGPKESANPKYQTGAYMSVGTTCKLGHGMNSSTFTTYPSTNGAISFWYPGVQKKLAELAGGDYYVAFTGISDFHIHPVNSTTPREVLERLKFMNRNINTKEEILSRKVYRYQAETGELKELEL